jgi:hypothetical protein
LNVVSIVYGRADYVALQRLACKAVFPEHTFLVAAHSDAPARARMPIDIDLAYQTSATWPQVYVEAVEQVRQRFQQDDLLVMESDIVPLAGAARLLSNSFAREYGAREYSGVRFFKQGASAPVLLPWAFVYDRADDPLQKWSTPFREEYIGAAAFLHFNAGDKPAPSGHQHSLFKHLCQVYQVEIQPLEAHEYRIAFTAPGQESEGEALAYAQWLAQQPRAPADPAAIRAEIATNEAALARMIAANVRPCEIAATRAHLDRLRAQLAALPAPAPASASAPARTAAILPGTGAACRALPPPALPLPALPAPASASASAIAPIPAAILPGTGAACRALPPPARPAARPSPSLHSPLALPPGAPPHGR